MRSASPARTRLVLVSALVAGVALASGCSNDRRAVEVRNNLTPELKNLHDRPEDVKNSLAIYFNEMDRMFWQDVGRAFYTDRPSRLTAEPVPY
mgnify:CR=1 FL=1